MTSFQMRTAALLVAGIALTAAPSFAQQGGRRTGGEAGRRDQGSERAQPRGDGQSRGRAESQGSQGRVESQGRVDNQGRAGESRGRVENQNRAGESRERVAPYRGGDNRNGGRAYDNRAYNNRAYNYRSFNNRAYNNRAFNYRYYGNRSYRIPYGYRPYGYRPGWSLNLYFGRPYAAYGAYGYPDAGYGYYSIIPGRAYGAVRIVDAPPDAQVFVDGNYAGVVDDYDGVFQHLNLEAGSHHIEIEAEGYPPLGFDVRVEPGQTITYRANLD